MHYLIFDGNNLLHRCHWILQQQGVLSEENLLQAIERSVYALKRDLGADQILFAWDKKLLWPSTNFRKQILEGTYKENREKSDVFEMESYVLEHLNFPHFFPRTLEADDVLCFLKDQLKEHTVTIVTNDKDLYQLISENVSIWTPRKKQLITLESFERDYGFHPSSFVAYKALVGDTSDSIEGVKGIGPKTATKWLQSGDIPIEGEKMERFKRNVRLIRLEKAYQCDELEEQALKDQWSRYLQQKGF